MKLPRRPQTVHYKSSQDKITSFSGLKFIADIANKLGILKGLERCTVKKRNRGIPAPDFVMSLVYNLLAGGSHLSDLEELRSEAATRDHLYGLDVPAPTTAGEYRGKIRIKSGTCNPDYGPAVFSSWDSGRDLAS